MQQIKATRPFKSIYTSSEFNSPAYRVEGVSATVPGQTMTVREMIRRHAAGLPVLGGKVPLYATDEEKALGIPDLSRLDRADQEQVLAEYRDQLNEMKKELERKTALIRQKQLDEQIEKLVEERLKARADAKQQIEVQNPDSKIS